MTPRRKDALTSDGTNIWPIAVIGMAVVICLSWCFGQDLIGLMISP
jgi:hypothetical protein